MNFEVEKEKLAFELNNYFYDYDTYEYNDCYSSKEEGYYEVLDLLSSDKGLNTLRFDINCNIESQEYFKDDSKHIKQSYSMLNKINKFEKMIKSLDKVC